MTTFKTVNFSRINLLVLTECAFYVYAYGLVTITNIIILKILFSDVLLFWKLSEGCLVMMENIVLNIPGQLYRPYYLYQENLSNFVQDLN